MFGITLFLVLRLITSINYNIKCVQQRIHYILTFGSLPEEDFDSF